MSGAGFGAAWATPAGRLTVVAAGPADVAVHAPALAAAYNDPHNARLLGHTAVLTEADVVEHYATLRAGNGHAFLLFVDGALAGDGDLRDVTAEAAEFAFLIAAPAAQGQGLGTRFALMIHGLAFAPPPRGLGLARVYAAVVPGNVASRRVFEKLGYVVDVSEPAAAFGDPGDVILRLERAELVRRHGEALAAIALAPVPA
ncbi:MAG: GNAT family N-acetyltransferase [Myxococcota bacterium]|nr:GNAT family N-acetyltransferase [Myxococcota bacterium]